ncbi:MAG TPA: LacI family DNA-binding transcriptional regulator [Lacunisphaera sp.]|nr:LacI family DNA-binding transcriptional regulator [Lacunisphaera sp.]
MPVPDPKTRPKGRVSLRDIAAAAGVCLMTVSLSLRDNPKISHATRDRVKKLARELGYHPDPEISRLMKRLRISRTARGTTSLAILDFYPRLDFAELSYHRQIRQGILARAEELGFAVSQFQAAAYKFNLEHILKLVRNRGIDGLILFPSVVAPLTLNPAVDWRDLSVVSVTNSILSPRFHCVVPHQFANMMRLIEAMKEHGRHKIAAVIEESFDERTAHHFTAAMNWHGHGRRILIVPNAAPAAQRVELIARWIARHDADMVFAQSPEPVISALARLRRRKTTAVAALGTPNNDEFSYLNEHPEVVGSAAVELLAGMMYYHETGIPQHPRMTMIDGELRLDRLTADASPLAAAGR